MCSITRNIVTARPKRVQETRPLKTFFLKISRTTPSENLRIYLVLRNNFFQRERERERKKSYRENFCKSQKCGILSFFKLSIGFV